MQIDIAYRPAHALAIVKLGAQESVRAESGAMVSMSSNIAVQTDGPMGGRQGGLLKSLKRVVLSGETFFTNQYVARGGPGEVTLAPSLAGDIAQHQLAPGEDLYIQGSSYLAAAEGVDLDTRWQGLKSLFSGESLFFLHASGSGPVLINAFGALQTIDFDGQLIVDTGHLVAFTSGITYGVTTASPGLIASWLSGEGLVLHLKGRGRLYLQTRNPSEYGTSIGRLLPARQE